MSERTERPAGTGTTLSRRRRRPITAVPDAPRWSMWLAIIGFALMMPLVILGPAMTNGDIYVPAGTRELGYAAVLLLAIVATRPWKHPERLLVVPWPLLLALGYCWFSLTWALDVGVGLRRLGLTTMVLWSVFALVRQLGMERSILVVRIALVVTLAINILVSLLYPEIGIQRGEDPLLGEGWRGIMGQKNFTGFTTAMAILFFAFDRGKVHLEIRAAVIVVGAVYLYLTDSETSQIMCVVALVFGGLFELLARSRGREQLAPPVVAWIPWIALGLLFLHIAYNPAVYFEMLSDPGGFTGRTQIWTALIKAYVDYPWRGLGYAAFWEGGPDGPVFRYATGWVTAITQGHNGYLDLLVQIGIPGTMIVLFAVLVWPLQRLLRGGNDPVRPLAAATFLFCLGHNFTESMLFDRDALSQVFLMIALALLWAATATGVEQKRAFSGR